MHAHAASTPDVNTQQYQGILAIQDLPTLPTAPEGECTIVLEAFGPKKSVAVVYHNASDQVMAINRVSAIDTSKYGTETPSVPEESNHGPHLLQPGE